MITLVKQAYRPPAKALHWLVVLLVVAQFITALLLPDIGPDVVPETIISLHFSFGVLILAVMAVRFVYRLLHPVPLEAANAPVWERGLARATHRMFYCILLIGPLLGWASASAHSLPVSLFGLIRLPDLAAPHAKWALTAGDIHTYMMWTLLGLVALHAGAALYHHLMRHDGTLHRMLPVRD